MSSLRGKGALVKGLPLIPCVKLQGLGESLPRRLRGCTLRPPSGTQAGTETQEGQLLERNQVRDTCHMSDPIEDDDFLFVSSHNCIAVINFCRAKSRMLGYSSWLSYLLTFRRTEEIILTLLDKPTKNLFDLNNPMFFEKNVLCENYTNLRRHLSMRSDSNESHGNDNETRV